MHALPTLQPSRYWRSASISQDQQSDPNPTLAFSRTYRFPSYVSSTHVFPGFYGFPANVQFLLLPLCLGSLCCNPSIHLMAVQPRVVQPQVHLPQMISRSAPHPISAFICTMNGYILYIIWIISIVLLKLAKSINSVSVLNYPVSVCCQ